MRIAKNVESDLKRIARFYSATPEHQQQLYSSALERASADSTFPLDKRQQGTYFYHYIRSLVPSAPDAQMPDLIRLHYRYLFTQMLQRANKRTGDIDQSEEIVQAAFTKALEHYGRHGWEPSYSDAVKSLSAYLCRIVETIFLDGERIKDRRKTDSTDEFKQGWAVDTTQADNTASTSMLTDRMKSFLTESEYTVAMLIGQGHTLSSAAETLQLTRGCVRNRLLAAKTKIRHYIITEEHG